MSLAKVNRKKVRVRAASKGITSLAELAREIGCSRPGLYFAIERPARYPNLHSRLVELIGEYHD